MSATFQTAIFFWSPDPIRMESLNVGIVLVSPQTQFCDGKVVNLPALEKLGLVFATPSAALYWFAQILKDLQQVAAQKKKIGSGGERMIRFDHPHIFHELFGESSPLSAIQWRLGPSGLLRGTPAEQLNSLYERFIQRPTAEE